MTKPLSALDLVEAFHLGHAVSALLDLEILDRLAEPQTAEALAERAGLDPQILRGTLEYVAARTVILSQTGECFVTTPSFSDQARFLLELYAGAYRRNAVRLKHLMGKPSVAPSVVDRGRHARAFEHAGEGPPGALVSIIQQLQLGALLDIGCGSGSLLVALAREDPRFTGWGLEINPAMCRVARAAIRAAGVGRRVKVREGDARQLQAALPATVRSSVRAVVASQVANEMFGAGSTGVVAWLREIRSALPDRPFLLSDYYGRLGRKVAPRERQVLLHDYAQLISGQGVPPASLAEWRAIYSEAGCRLVHVIEDGATTGFIHVLVLSSPDGAPPGN